MVIFYERLPLGAEPKVRVGEGWEEGFRATVKRYSKPVSFPTPPLT
jgi:hypothetical protein